MISASSNESLILPSPRSRAAMFIDWENVVKIGLRKLQSCIEDVRQQVNVSVTRAYANWTQNVPGSVFLTSIGAELTHVGGKVSGKNSADMQLTVDACELLLTTTHLECLVLISGDRDFRPLVSLARKRGLWVWGIGPADSSSDILRTCCDRFLELQPTPSPKTTAPETATPTTTIPETVPSKRKVTKPTSTKPSTSTKKAKAPKTPPKPPARQVPSAVPLPPIDDELCQQVAAAFQDVMTDKETKATPVNMGHFFASLRKCSPEFNASKFTGRTNRTQVYSARRLQAAGLLEIIPNSPHSPNVQPTQVIMARIQAQ